MTPGAVTPAGQRKQRPDDHRARVKRQPAPRPPRRISGPTGGRSRAAAAPAMSRAARAAAAPAMSRAAHAAAAPATKQAARSAARPLTPSPEARIAAAAVTLADHRLLDRVVRGRIWIPLLGVMLSGIVAMQVETLKLGASIGRSLDRTTAMQSRNQLLRASVASLADDQRIERLAARMGMVMAPPDGIGFLPASSGTDVSHAMANIHAPNPQDFLSQGGGNGAVIGQGGGNGAVVGQGGGNGAVVGQGGGNGAVVGAGGAAAGATTVSATSANSTASATATATPSAVGTSGSSSSGTHG